MLKIYFYSSLSFSLYVCVLCLASSFCDDQQLFGMSICRNPWWSFRRWRCSCL